VKICYFGTYDVTQPRTRVILEGLRQLEVDVQELHADLWSGTSQKVTLASHPSSALKYIGKWCRVYRSLMWRRKDLRDCDVVVYGHLGQIDLLVTAWWFRRRRIPVVWDALVSLEDTVVHDRALVRGASLWAKLLHIADAVSGRLADCVLVDTDQNRVYWRDRFGIPDARLRVVPVGAEALFELAATSALDSVPVEEFRVLFFGKYIPLHGVETIVRAAYELRDHRDIVWRMIGVGQHRSLAEQLVRSLGVTSVRFVDWVPYEQLPAEIAGCDIGLGIFGTTDKAQRVVPNKVYQILAGGRPLITADTPAVRDLFDCDGSQGVCLIPAGDPRALAAAVIEMRDSPQRLTTLANQGSLLFSRSYTAEAVGRQVFDICSALADRSRNRDRRGSIGTPTRS